MSKIVTNVKAFVKGNGFYIYRPTCPACGAVIHAQAAVETFMLPEGWIFYGEKGKRVKVCQDVFMGHPFIHFAVKLPNGVNNRLAWFEIEGM